MTWSKKSGWPGQSKMFVLKGFPYLSHKS